jgi:hypothetical protein
MDKNVSLPDSTGGNGQKVTLLEFFQSQSCDSCPPANETLINLVSKQDRNSLYLLLTYHVTYWNHLSWRDTFSNHSFDVRQREYLRRRGNEQGLYTPMLVVNGRSVGVGNTKEAVAKLIAEGQSKDPTDDAVSKDRAKLVIETNQFGQRVANVDFANLYTKTGDGELNVFVISYTHSPKDVLVTRGENAGRTFRHRNVVTRITKIGFLTRESVRPYPLPSTETLKGEGRAVVVQDGPGGEIVEVVVL